LKIKKSLYLRNRSSDHDEILQDHANCGRKPRGKLKVTYLGKFKMADVRHIGNRKLAIFPEPFV